eukprot:1264692-Prymnesium_polylepis.1
MQVSTSSDTHSHLGLQTGSRRSHPRPPCPDDGTRSFPERSTHADEVPQPRRFPPPGPRHACLLRTPCIV